MEAEINKILDLVILKSKFKNLNPTQTETLKSKIIQKYLNDFNLTALEMLSENLKPVFSRLLEASNQVEIENFILNNIQNTTELSQKTAQKFSRELYLILK